MTDYVHGYLLGKDNDHGCAWSRKRLIVMEEQEEKSNAVQVLETSKHDVYLKRELAWSFGQA